MPYLVARLLACTWRVKAEAAVSRRGAMERRAALLSHPGGREGCKERAERAHRCRDAPWADLMAVDMEIQAPV
eukprot:515474-Prymnesium_polylepis.2